MHPDEALDATLDRIDTLSRLRDELDRLADDNAPARLIVSCLGSIHFNAAALQSLACELATDLDPDE